MTNDRSGASKPVREAGMTGKSAETGSNPSPGDLDRDQGEVSSADDCEAIDLESARDRAS